MYLKSKYDPQKRYHFITDRSILNCFDRSMPPSRARRFALTRQRIFDRPVHQRGIVAAKQYFTESNRRNHLRLPVGSHPGFTAAQ
jgi:hypothetical protein